MKKILIVDDNEILLKAWRRILSDEPCKCITTTNPKEAIQWIEDESVDVLISDIVMPKMDGFDLLKAAREIQHKLQVVLTTGYICDFSKVNFDVELKDLHILMKPYNNIGKVGGFVHRLLENDPELNKEEIIHGKNDLNIHLWNL